MREDNMTEVPGKWNLAAKDGLWLAAISVGALLLSSLLTHAGVKGFLGTIVGFLLWSGKTAGSIWLLHRLMWRYSERLKYVSYGKSFGYGLAICLCSSLAVAVYSYLSIQYLFPAETEAVVATMEELMSSQSLTSAQEESIERLIGSLPNYVLFANMIYLTIYGAIASSIIASFTKRDNIFDMED